MSILHRQLLWRVGLFACSAVLVAPLLSSVLFPAPARATSILVNSTEDTDDGTCDHPYAGAATDCTLREALNASNGSAGADSISFAIDGAFANDGDGQWTIAIGSALPVITDTLTLSAASVWDADDDRPGIRLTGGSGFHGLELAAGSDGSVISGLEIDGFSTGIEIDDSNITVGTNCDASLDAFERNVIHGQANLQSSVHLDDASGARIRGNYIGTESDGVTLDGFGNYGVFIDGPAADDNVIGYEEGTSGTCAAVLQRNVIGGGGNQFTRFGVYIANTAAGVVLDGDSSLGPDNNRVSGNYIGIGADGVTDIGIAATGVRIAFAATENFIGTDGDGIDDAFEGNVISGWGTGLSDGTAVAILSTGYNRVSGNTLGLSADLTSAIPNSENGILGRGTGNIFGWCDGSIDASLCSNGGSVSTQRNIIAGNEEDGVRAGYQCESCRIFGNLIGTSNGTTDFGNGNYGIFLHRGTDDLQAGGPTSNHRNTVMFNGLAGISIDGFDAGGGGIVDPTENWVIQNNLVRSNDGPGIIVIGTEHVGTVQGPSDGDVRDNEIDQNAGAGMLIQGSSPTIDGNSITDNGGAGIDVRSTYRFDEPTGGATPGTEYNHPTDTLNPLEATEDDVSEPTITSNAIDGNAGGGIFLLDTVPSNESTLAADNAIGINGGFDVRKNWYVAAELLDELGDPVTAGSLAVTFKPAHGLSCTGTCVGSSFASAGGGEGIWGPSGIDYTDASTWFSLTEYSISTAGVLQEYSPYKLTVSGDYRETAALSLSLDGDASNELDTAHLPAGIATDGIDRYAILETIVRETSGSNNNSSLLALSAPIALTPVPLDDHSIRWNFRDTASVETGFRIVRYEGTVEIVLADTGNDAVHDLAFLEEADLSPSTEYCGRFVLAVNGEASSFPTPLPCASTLAPGRTQTDFSIPDLSLSQTVSYISEGTSSTYLSFDDIFRDRMVHTGVPVGIFILTVGFGFMKLDEKRKKDGLPSHDTKAIRHLIVVGLLVATGAFTGIQLALSPLGHISAAGTFVPVTSDVQLIEGDRVKFDFVLENRGDALAENLVFTDHFPASVSLLSDRLIYGRLGRSVTSLRAVLSEQSLIVRIPDLPAGDKVHISIEAIVISANTISNEAVVTGSRVPDITSNTVLLHVSPRTVVRPDPAPAFSEGMVVKSPSVQTVFWIDENHVRHLFFNEPFYFSWFPDFSNVITVADGTLIDIPMGAPMLTRPGTWLVKSVDSPKVYAVEPGNVLRWIPSEERAIEMYGSDWTSYVVDIEPGLLWRYSRGLPLEEGEYPNALLLSDGKITCYMEDQLCREVSPDGMETNHFQSRFTFPIPNRLLSTFPRKDRIESALPMAP